MASIVERPATKTGLLWAACQVNERLNTGQEDVGKDFARNREQSNGAVAAAVHLWSFSFVQCYQDAVFPVRGYVSCSPDLDEDFVQSLRDLLKLLLQLCRIIRPMQQYTLQCTYV